MKQDEPTPFLYEYKVNKDRVVISIQIVLVEMGKAIECTTIFMKIKFPHRESNPGRLRERQES